MFFLLHILCFRNFSANLHLFLLFWFCFHHHRYVVLAAALPFPCVWCRTTRSHMCSSVHLPSIWYLQFYICGFIFVIFCSTFTWGPHHTTSVSRNQLDFAFYVGLQDSCSCLRYLLPVTYLPVPYLPVPLRAGLPSPLPTAAPQLTLSVLPAQLPRGGFLHFYFGVSCIYISCCGQVSPAVLS